MKRRIYIDLTVTLCVIILYIVNNRIIKKSNIAFFLYYFNDFLCPFFVLAFVNIIMWFYGKQVTKLWKMIVLMILCGFLWECYSINPKAVADPIDMICYIGGAIGYWWIKNKYILWIDSSR